MSTNFDTGSMSQIWEDKYCARRSNSAHEAEDLGIGFEFEGLSLYQRFEAHRSDNNLYELVEMILDYARDCLEAHRDLRDLTLENFLK
jgi:hypothetical protein